MQESFDAFSDDFFLNMCLQTALPLPESRETILQFCEATQREYADMTTFFQRETGEFVLEGDRDSGSYRWMELDARRLSSGYFNPLALDDAIAQHQWVLDRCRYYLGVSHLDVDSLDVVLGFNLDYRGNRDAIVAEALYAGSSLGVLLEEPQVIPLSVEPNLIISLDPDCYTQARLNLETRNNSYQVRTGQYDDEPISVYLTVRSYPRPGQKFDPDHSFGEQCRYARELTERIILPRVIQPIAAKIAASQ